MRPISLLDYHNGGSGVEYLWYCGVGCPTGIEFRHNTTTELDDYCDLIPIIDALDLWQLTGHVTGGRWEWDGDGNPTDSQANTIYNIKAMP